MDAGTVDNGILSGLMRASFKYSISTSAAREQSLSEILPVVSGNWAHPGWSGGAFGEPAEVSPRSLEGPTAAQSVTASN